MPKFPHSIPSRLPRVGTTLFTVMSRLAAESGAINLSQGFPDFSAPDELFSLIAKYMRKGYNQYALMAGAVPLREAIAAKASALYGRDYGPDSEFTVTAGATQAIFTAVAAMVRPGDEVLVFEPVTGWKVGYVLAPAQLMAEFRKAHQFIVLAVSHPAQLALAEFMQERARHLSLSAFYQDKRDFFRKQLEGSRLRLLPCAGTYFQSVCYEDISDEPEVAFAQRLTREVGVASIPVSVFYREPQDDKVLRFCFAKSEDTLARAGERLREL